VALVTDKHLHFTYDDAGRWPVTTGLQMTMEAYDRGASGAAIGHDIPPRVGKSSLIALIAIEAKSRGVPFVHVMTPWEDLAKQLTDSKKLKQTLRLYGPKEKPPWPITPHRVETIGSSSYHKRQAKAAQPYAFVTSTIHLAKAAEVHLKQAVSLASEEGQPAPIIIIDECHLLGDGQVWAKFVNDLIALGAFAVTLTGTSLRSDKSPMPGFTTVTQGEWEERTRFVTEGIEYFAHPDLGIPMRRVIGKSQNGSQAECVTQARGLTVTWEEAFKAKWINKVSAIPVDFKCVTAEGDVMNISQSSVEIARLNIGLWMRSSECCRALAEAAVNNLGNLWRSNKKSRNTKMLVVTSADLKKGKGFGSDDDKESNAHAREMRRQIESVVRNNEVLQPQGLTVEICTSVNEKGEPDMATQEKLKRFRLTEPAEEGGRMLTPIDILIVKGMGVVGLDCPECKVLIDASTVRKGPLKRQLATRNLTIWTGVNKESYTYYPEDPENHEFYSNLQNASGSFKNFKVIGEDDLEIESPVEEKPDLAAPIVPGSGEVAGCFDEAGQWVSGNYEDLIAKICRKWPAMLETRHIDIIKMYEDGAFRGIENEPDRTSEQDDDQGDAASMVEAVDDVSDGEPFGTKAKRLINQNWPQLYMQDPEEWRNRNKRLMRIAKVRCRMSPHVSVESIDDPARLQELKDSLDHAIITLKEEVRA
jgi:hypothetical protein